MVPANVLIVFICTSYAVAYGEAVHDSVGAVVTPMAPFVGIDRLNALGAATIPPPPPYPPPPQDTVRSAPVMRISSNFIRERLALPDSFFVVFICKRPPLPQTSIELFNISISPFSKNVKFGFKISFIRGSGYLLPLY
jgi:hypothetical protein